MRVDACVALIAMSVAVLWEAPAAATGQEREIQPPDVYMTTMLVRGELEAIREIMGKPRVSRPEPRVRNAQPREVYFQAATLFLKAERLCSQLSETESKPPVEAMVTPPETLRPVNVLNVVNRARDLIQCATVDPRLIPATKAPPRDPTKTPTDVFTSLIQANRQLDLLLERRFSPSDVFALVELCNEYMATLLEELLPDWRSNKPALPSYEADKRPVDVYRELFKCFRLIHRIAKQSGLVVLDLEPQVDPSIVPSDVFDMASLVLSEIRYFAVLLHVQAPHVLNFPADKVPSDVFQRVRLLERQLQLLGRLADKSPTWHTTKR